MSKNRRYLTYFFIFMISRDVADYYISSCTNNNCRTNYGLNNDWMFKSTCSTTTAPTPVVVLAVTLTEPFVEELTDHNSTECKTLETRVVKAVSMTS